MIRPKIVRQRPRVALHQVAEDLRNALLYLIGRTFVDCELDEKTKTKQENIKTELAGLHTLSKQLASEYGKAPKARCGWDQRLTGSAKAQQPTSNKMSSKALIDLHFGFPIPDHINFPIRASRRRLDG